MLSALFVSSTLSANFRDMASILISGFVLRNNAVTRVESTPPLNATEI